MADTRSIHQPEFVVNSRATVEHNVGNFPVRVPNSSSKPVGSIMLADSTVAVLDLSGCILSISLAGAEYDAVSFVHGHPSFGDAWEQMSSSFMTSGALGEQGREASDRSIRKSSSRQTTHHHECGPSERKVWLPIALAFTSR